MTTRPMNSPGGDARSRGEEQRALLALVPPLAQDDEIAVAQKPELAADPAGARFCFPSGFMFGAATSAHQVEGGCKNNDWWRWEEAGRVPERSALACDHYHRFAEDFDIARSLAHNAHRFSIEWSRIEPAEGRFSDEAIEHYREVLVALRERGLEPVVTLFHFTLPLWLAEQGGWECPRVVRLFERYARRMAREFGDLVRWWITINEPVAQVYKGYVIGDWPPGKRDFRAAVVAYRAMLHAHVHAYLALHETSADAQVSVATHTLALQPHDRDSWRDRLSVGVRRCLVNHLFVDALHDGVVRAPGLIWERLPAARTLDFLGLNYYTRDFVGNEGFSPLGLIGGTCSALHAPSVGARNSLGWEVYPEGLGEILGDFRRYNLPVLVSENGIATERDAERLTFIYMHLWQVARAVERGVPVVGYLYWSLLDNYEWAEGFAPRFGLVEVDYATQRRRVRPSALALADIIRRNQL